MEVFFIVVKDVLDKFEKSINLFEAEFVLC